MDVILLESNKKMIYKQGKLADFMDDFHALFGYILRKYRLSKKLCSNHRPEFAKWSIYRSAIILWTTVDTLPLKGDFHVHFHLKCLELIWMASESWGPVRFGLYGLY